MKEFRDYDIKYPELIFEILKYFNINNQEITKKSIIDFCTQYTKPGVEMLQPVIITKICEILCNHDILTMIRRDGGMGINNNYIFIKDINQLDSVKDEIIHFYNSLVYGFEYIYRYYTNKVIPIVAYKKDGTPMIGSCFRFLNGIVTAKHCLEDGCSIAIQGFTKEQLNKSHIYVSKNRYVDIAYIHLSMTPEKSFINSPHVLDEVLVMGYPMIPRFLNFLTVEKATISSLADLRFTPSRGAITAVADEMFTKDTTKLMLITARITGGNSGGPIINKSGSIIGVAISDTTSEGECYDNLGYGIAVPIETINTIIEEKEEIKICFQDFHE